MTLRAIDLFAGAGGFTAGAVHAANHPDGESAPFAVLPPKDARRAFVPPAGLKTPEEIGRVYGG